MAKINLDPPLVPKNGLVLKSITIDRISTKNQDEKSNDDQLAGNKKWVKDRFDSSVEWTRLTGQGSGENLEREDVAHVQKLVESGEYDLVIMEDLGRYLRRIYAVALCELCEDTNTRLIAINDNIDTASDWRLSAYFATMKHEMSNKDTSMRIRRSLRNRFMNGEILRTPIYGIIKPEGAKHDSKLEKDPQAEVIYDGWFTKLEQGANYSEIADWLNEQEIPTGPDCQLEHWDCKMVSRITKNPMLKGDRERNRMKSKRYNKSGRYKPEKADSDELLVRHCEHLIFIEPERFDRVNRMLAERNKRYRRGKNNACDPLKGRPKKRTRYPGQSVRCGVCGRLYLYGGHGQTDRLMCSGAREYKCWNGITFAGEDVREQLVPLIMKAIEELSAFEPEYIMQLQKEVSDLELVQNARHLQLDKKERKLKREVSNITSAIKESGANSFLLDELSKLQEHKYALQLQRDELNRIPVSKIVIPDIETVKQLARDQFGKLTAESPEFARLLKQLIPQFFVFPYRLVDGGHPVLRASVTFTAAPLVSLNEESLPSLSERLAKQWQFDLFVPPQREIYRERVMELTEKTKLKEHDIAKLLEITQPAVQNAKKLARLMVKQGITEAYQPLLTPPEDYSKLKRHLHKRYHFEPQEGYPLEYPTQLDSMIPPTRDSR